jgi:hypothetical protein
VLDDLHAADADSLHLLRFVARDLLQSRILILTTYRETEPRDRIYAEVIVVIMSVPGCRELLA